MSSSKAEGSAIDAARQVICREFARMLNAGTSTTRVRIVRTSGEPTEAWFYSHGDDGWHKEPGGITDRKLALALEETLEMLASREHSDEWSARKQSSSDFHDTDFHFHRDKVEPRLGDQLESALEGLLFRDRHDSKKDKRHAIRTPRGGTGHR